MTLSMLYTHSRHDSYMMHMPTRTACMMIVRVTPWGVIEGRRASACLAAPCVTSGGETALAAGELRD